MKIACVDRTAADRLALQKFIDGACDRCRDAVGHLGIVQTHPAAKDEILLAAEEEIVVVGSGFSLEEAFLACRDIRSAKPGAPLFLLLRNEAYTLRSLRRFQKLCTDVFALEENPIRLVHRLSAAALDADRTKSGKLIAVFGVKGGVGATSLVSGLAHAAEATGRSAVVIDLSAHGALVQYLGLERWHSVEYTAALTDRLRPERRLVEKCLDVAPNGVTVLLPPAGAYDVRELWLRGAQTFEVTMGMIDILRDLFDVVLVDIAGAEGILPFSILSRADVRLLISTNDPAAVHLLTSQLSETADIPGASATKVLINALTADGLSREDVLDFLYANDRFEESMVLGHTLGRDARAAYWIGSRNTFFTEASSATRRVLESVILALCTGEETTEETQGFFSRLGQVARRFTDRRLPHTPRRALPYRPPAEAAEELRSSPPVLLRPATERHDETGQIVESASVSSTVFPDTGRLFESPKAVS